MEVVIGLNGGTLAGRALDSNRQPLENATVLLVPDASGPIRFDRYKSASTDESGRFLLRRLPPGAYTAYAWEDVDLDAWLNPAFLRLYENNGQPVRIDESGQGTIDLNIIPATN